MVNDRRKSRETEEDDRIIGAGIGGALLGASLAGPPGAIIGGLIGLFLGDTVNKEKRQKERGDK